MNDQTQKIVRVAANNNFNCTAEEFAQLDEMADKNPNCFFFINSNIKTPRLSAVNDHKYRAVITVNPDLHVKEEQVARLYTVDFDKVAFVRVKWLPENAPIEDLALGLSEHGYNVVITSQRFNSKDSLRKYTSFEHYEFSCSRYRLSGAALEYLERFVDSHPRIHMCDRAELGCQGCGLCSKLTTGEDKPILSVNLSTSGVCKYNCPDCYAHQLQNFQIATGKRPMKYDTIKKNRKQRG
ncbi:MAG: hypothetical protein GF414_07485, partial [Candidatus Altiarchaeales archaeon]|nr:hypothetical protein [Candidatus Altiarchaeales archaeon]